MRSHRPSFPDTDLHQQTAQMDKIPLFLWPREHVQNQAAQECLGGAVPVGILFIHRLDESFGHLAGVIHGAVYVLLRHPFHLVEDIVGSGLVILHDAEGIEDVDILLQSVDAVSALAATCRRYRRQFSLRINAEQRAAVQAKIWDQRRR